mgnify:CR=1 FL=1
MELGNKAALTGIGETRYAKESDKSQQTLTFEASLSAIEDAGLDPKDIDGVRRMTEALYHRGPDSEGFLTAANASLGIRRLSIIDQKGGNQPIYNTACSWRSRTGKTIAKSRENSK